MADFNLWSVLISYFVGEFIAALLWYEKRYAAADKKTKQKIMSLYSLMVFFRVCYIIPCIVLIYSIWNMFRETYNNPFNQKSQFWFFVGFAFVIIVFFLASRVVVNKLTRVTNEFEIPHDAVDEWRVVKSETCSKCGNDFPTLTISNGVESHNNECPHCGKSAQGMDW